MAKTRPRRKTVTDAPDAQPSHRPNGQFAPGNKLGRGNPNIRRLAEYRQTVNDAVTPAQLRRVLAKLVKLALSGDIAAIKELLDRTLGKSTPAPTGSDPLAVEFPTLTTTKDTVTAANAILGALADGRLNADDAAKLSAIVELARRSLETHEIAERLAALEERARKR